MNFFTVELFIAKYLESIILDLSSLSTVYNGYFVRDPKCFYCLVSVQLKKKKKGTQVN